MRDASFILRSAYFSRLNGIQYQGNQVPVYDSYADVGEASPYIVLAEISDYSIDNKGSFEQTYLFTVDVVTEFPEGSNQGRMMSEQIADLVLQAILPNLVTDIDLGPDFELVELRKVNGQSLTERSDTTKVFRKVLQFSNLVNQLSDG